MPQQQQGYPIPGISQSVGAQNVPAQPPHDNGEREAREARDREAREAQMDSNRRMQQREREGREQMMRERDQMVREGQQTTPRQNHAEPVQLHQPVAIGPQMRSAIHGPNGLLNQSGPGGNANAPASAPPAGPMHLFSPHYGERTLQANAQGQQLGAQNMLFGSGTPSMQQMAMPPGQQPILNVSESFVFCNFSRSCGCFNSVD